MNILNMIFSPVAMIGSFLMLLFGGMAFGCGSVVVALHSIEVPFGAKVVPVVFVILTLAAVATLFLGVIKLICCCLWALVKKALNAMRCDQQSTPHTVQNSCMQEDFDHCLDAGGALAAPSSKRAESAQSVLRSRAQLGAPLVVNEEREVCKV